MTSLVFPDVNVWLALASRRHIHHNLAYRWLESLEGIDLAFCRITQLGLLRLLTTSAVMSVDVLTQRQAWQAYDRLLSDRVHFLDEPPTIESRFRLLTHQSASSPKEWADAYLTAFASEAKITLATLDRALATKSGGTLVG
jgi:hypothetical protein